MFRQRACRLNSRQLTVSRGIHISNDALGYGMNIISRANRLAAHERWNVPQVRSPLSTALDSSSLLTVRSSQAPKETEPNMIDIRVTTEVEGELPAKRVEMGIDSD